LNPAGTAGSAPERRSPSIAAFLSFLWPGLGHWYTRRDRAAVLFALPVIGVAAIVAMELAGGVGQIAALLISPSSALTVAILVVLLGAWREVAVIDAAIAIRPRGAWRRGRSLIVVVLVTAIIAVSHAWAGYVAWAFYNAGSQIFVGSEGPDAAVAAAVASSPGPGSQSGAASDPGGAPNPAPLSSSGRTNILLTSVDSTHASGPDLTDTIIVASIDPNGRDIALISFPREISNFPLARGGIYSGRINGFIDYVRTHPTEFKERPIVELVKELSFLLGTPIRYYAAVDLQGFRNIVDAAGGVTITTDRRIDDPTYDWSDGRRGFTLPAGTHTLDGSKALAYVRARAAPDDGDLDRARRQQQVLLALGTKLTTAAMLPRIPGLVSLAGDTIRTNFPSDKISGLLDLAERIDGSNVRRIVLGEPYAYRPGGTSVLRLDMQEMAALSVKLFGDESTYQRP
jgi:polyisoprenyl-teichoic acid--peptidoglycan teichoic acid transferase